MTTTSYKNEISKILEIITHFKKKISYIKLIEISNKKERKKIAG